MTILSKLINMENLNLSQYWDRNYILGGVIIFSWSLYLWDLYLDKRQRNVYKNCRSIPDELKSVITNDTFEKSRRYKLDSSRFGLIHTFFDQILDTSFLAFAVYPYIWNVSKNIIKGTRLDSEIPQSLVFTGIFCVVSYFISLPWSYYANFVIEQRHGFNKMTVPFFIKDQLKAWALKLILGPPILAGILYVIKIGGRHFYIYAWLFTFLLSSFIITIYPTVIAPIFDKYTPLDSGYLRNEIEKLASKLNFPLTQIYVVEGSKRSSHSNAYFFGFFKQKRIVIFDTILPGYKKSSTKDKDTGKIEHVSEGDEKYASLLSEENKLDNDKKETKTDKTMTNEEILAVIAHELGHWYHSHMIKNFAVAQVHMFLSFYAFSYLMDKDVLYRAFGFYDEKPILIGLLLILNTFLKPYELVMEFFQNVFSRRYEYQADRFSVHQGLAPQMISSLLTLHKDNLSFPADDPLYAAWHFSHPTTVERIKAIKMEQQEHPVPLYYKSNGIGDDKHASLSDMKDFDTFNSDIGDTSNTNGLNEISNKDVIGNDNNIEDSNGSSYGVLETSDKKLD